MPVEECIRKYDDVIKIVEHLIEARIAKEEDIKRAFIGTAKCLWDLSYTKGLINKSEYERISGAFTELKSLIERGRIRELENKLRKVSDDLLKLISMKCSRV